MTSYPITERTPVPYKVQSLEEIVQYAEDKSHNSIVRMVVSRVRFFVAAFTMLHDAVRLLKFGAEVYLRERRIVPEAIEALVQAGKYVTLAVASLALGLVMPTAVKWIYRNLGLVHRVGRILRLAIRVARFTQLHPYAMTLIAIACSGGAYAIRSAMRQPGEILPPFYCFRLGGWRYPEACS